MKLSVFKTVLLFIMVAFSFSLINLVRGFDKESVINRFHEYAYNSSETWGQNTWFGIPTLQNPNDVWIIQEIISETKPDIIIETGTFQGGSAILWAWIQQQVNPNGRVITIDVKQPTDDAKNHSLFKKHVTFYHKSSTDPELIQELKALTKGKSVFIILDSLHTRDHVLDELKLYHSMVQVGNYILVQDTNVNGHPVLSDYGPGPMEAVEDFMKASDQFVIDKSRERWLFTMHPNGYLKRIK